MCVHARSFDPPEYLDLVYSTQHDRKSDKHEKCIIMLRKSPWLIMNNDGLHKLRYPVTIKYM